MTAATFATGPGGAAPGAPADRSMPALDDALAAGDAIALVDAVVASARSRGDRVLLRQGRRGMTGAELATRVERVTLALARRGMQPGDVILFGVRPGIDCLVLLLAAMRLGACTTFIDPGVGPELFERRLELLRPAWVMAETLLYAASVRSPLTPHLRRLGLELPRLAQLDARHVRVGRRLPGLVPRSPSVDSLAREVPSDAARALLPVRLDPDAPSLVIFTSGTTGAPKGVQHTGRSMTAAVRLMLANFDVDARAVLYTHNVHTFVVGILRGALGVVAPLSIAPGRFLADVAQHRVTHAFLLPIEAWRLALHCEQAGERLPEHLQGLFLFSAPITTTVLERVHAVGPPDLRITCAYAMTEMIPVAWVDSREKLAFEGEGDLVGLPCPGVDARIEDGELRLRGANMHGGYIGMQRAGWHRTGDIARIDELGRIVLLGRDKDMLIRGDFNLYPGLYEGTVSRIAGVGACAIVGVPDAQTGDERVVLFVEPDPASVGTAGALDAAGLARAVERGVRSGATAIDAKARPDEVRVLAALPRAGRSSKVNRIRLRELAALPAVEETSRGDVRGRLQPRRNPRAGGRRP